MPDSPAPSPAPGKRRIALDTAANGISQAASVVVSIAFLPLLVRAFGLASYGLFMLSVTVAGYTYLLDLGIGVTVVRMVAERLERDHGVGVGGVVASAVVLFGAAGLLASGLMLAVGAAAGVVFRVSAGEAALLRTLLWMGAAYQLVYWPASAARHALGGYQRYDLLAVLSLSTTGLYAASIAAVLVLGRGPVALTLLNIVSGTVISVAGVFVLGRLMRPAGGRFAPSLATMRDMVRSGFPVFLVQIAHTVNRQHTDRLVLGVLVGPAAVAVYEIAAKVAALVGQAGDLVVSAILPVASRLSVGGAHDRIRALFLRGAKYTSILVAPLTVVLAFLAGPFIGVWFGPGFEASVPLAVVLLVAQLFVPLYLVGDSILIGMDRFARWTPWALGLATLNLLLSVGLVLRFGLIGVALGTLVSYMLEFPVYGRMLTRETGVTGAVWLKASMLPTYPLLALPAAVCAVVLMTPLTSSVWGVAAGGAVAMGAYWLAAWRASLSGQERSQALSFVRGLAPRRGPGAVGGAS